VKKKRPGQTKENEGRSIHRKLEETTLMLSKSRRGEGLAAFGERKETKQGEGGDLIPTN